MLFALNPSVEADDGTVREDEWQTLMSHARADRVKLAQKLRAGMSTKTLEAMDRARQINLRLLNEYGLVSREDWKEAVANGKTDGPMSEVMLRYIRIQAMAREIWPDADKATEWLERSNRALGGEKPLALIDTDQGAAAVETLLGHIEHGIAS